MSSPNTRKQTPCEKRGHRYSAPVGRRAYTTCRHCGFDRTTVKAAK